MPRARRERVSWMQLQQQDEQGKRGEGRWRRRRQVWRTEWRSRRKARMRRRRGRRLCLLLRLLTAHQSLTAKRPFKWFENKAGYWLSNSQRTPKPLAG
jgi:hypothetical protein